MSEEHISSSPSNSPSYRGSGALIALFISAHTFVWVGSTLIIFTVLFSAKLYRHPTWVNLKLSWILACFSFSCLFTTGQLYKSQPAFPVCLTQASAIYAVPSLTSGATLAVAISLFLRIRDGGKNIDPKIQRLRTLALLGIPYILPTIIFIGILSYGARNRDQVALADNWMVCGIVNPIVGKAADILVVVIMIPTVAIETFTIIYVYRRAGQSLGRKIVHLLGRLVIFTMFGIFGVVVSFTFSNLRFAGAWQSAIANVLLALPPLAYISLFGLQKDILLTWAFWRHRQEPKEDKLPKVDSIGTFTTLNTPIMVIQRQEPV